MTIEVKNIVKKFGAFAALDNVDLKVGNGELLALLGPSGSGKTTLLRIIAGLDWPDAGEVSFDGENALARGASERHVGFVFQHYALFRHMTVFENVAFGLRVQPRAIRKDEATIRARVKELLDLVQLDWLANRYPSQLSGGQRQRIALARALAIEPRILLLDEPFGALDAKVRKELRQWLRSLHSEIHVTSIFVTHDQEEALEVANRVVVMDKGRIEQIGTPGESMTIRRPPSCTASSANPSCCRSMSAAARCGSAAGRSISPPTARPPAPRNCSSAATTCRSGRPGPARWRARCAMSARSARSSGPRSRCPAARARP